MTPAPNLSALCREWFDLATQLMRGVSPIRSPSEAIQQELDKAVWADAVLRVSEELVPHASGRNIDPAPLFDLAGNVTGATLQTWEDARKIVKHLAACSDTPRQEPPAPKLAVDILHDAADLKVRQIAADKTKGGNERMRAIISIDARYAGKPSTWWAELLGVLDGTVRSYETWKTIQRQRKAAD